MNTATEQITVPASPNYWKTMHHLIRREYWEYKALYLWVPLALSLCLLCFLSYVCIDAFFIVERNRVGFSFVKPMMLELYFKFFGPVFVTMSFVGIYHLMSSLHDDRQDRSVLFWKSLPVSDWQTVLAKISLPLIFGPVMAFAMSLISYLIFCVLISTIATFHGFSLFSVLILDEAMWKTPLKLVTLFPIYVAWALPTVGWLLMISAWSKSRVFPWAFGMPFLAMLILTFGNFYAKFGWNLVWVFNNIFGRLLGGLLPGTWAVSDSLQGMWNDEGHDMFNFGDVYTQAWVQFGGLKFWMGIAVGLALIFTAVRQRRYAEAI
ncbi:hypothetical protein H8K35_18010 [Undibacterium sp. LX40W]|uniref:ABC-2 type transport system permease protein n=1 Tax=Undibacterium nitidum TaxID=2762298 RepID=A0A923KQS5_9BURK|nr:MULTISPECIES: hypothetical protein [Undibacterium]MBC3883278.1 hypothetical protein [Undibacterium nitidum]MBC3893575.1 hypothetical protein [Undibacterium sp. LX40W]